MPSDQTNNQTSAQTPSDSALTTPRQQTGHCRCGATSIAATGDPLITSACHCRGCQRMTSSAFSLSAMFPSEGFSVLSGELTKGGAQSPGLDHYICSACGSWMYTRIAMLPDMVNLRAPMFDVPRWCDPFIETMTTARLRWAQTCAVHSYEGFPEPESFAALLSEFRAWL